MDNADGANVTAAVGTQPVLDGLRVDTAAPVGLEKLGLDPKLVRHFLPQGGKMAGLDHQHALALVDQVGKRRFPGAGARRRIDDHRRVGLENRFHAVEAFPAELGKGRAAMVDGRMIHRPQDSVRNICRSGDLQEMPAGLIGARIHVR